MTDIKPQTQDPQGTPNRKKQGTKNHTFAYMSHHIKYVIF